MDKFIHQCYEVNDLNNQIAYQEYVDLILLISMKHEVIGKQNGGREHCHYNGEAIRGFHGGRLPEV